MSAGFFVHPAAEVEPGAIIGPGSKIWRHAHVMSGAVIGSDCMLGQGVFVAGGVRIGAGSRVQNNVSLFAGVELAEDVFVGPSVVFTNVARPRAAHPCHGAFEKTIVQRGATLGANATIRCGVTIGRGAFVAAGAVVTRDVPPFTMVMGVPARRSGFVCWCGAGLDSGLVCAECGAAFVSEGDGLAPKDASGVAPA